MSSIRYSMPIIGAAFDCPRSCRTCETVDVCRFNLILNQLGVRRVVNSETVSVDVDFENEAALRTACEKIGATVQGFGDTWRVYGNGNVPGFAFTMPNACNPVVFSGGRLLADDMFSRFTAATAETLRAEYSIAAANEAAARLGWMTERLDNANGATLRVFHPSGGYLDVGAGSVEAFQFTGGGCHNAADELATAMGTVSAVSQKPEAYQNELNVNQGEL